MSLTSYRTAPPRGTLAIEAAEGEARCRDFVLRPLFGRPVREKDSCDGDVACGRAGSVGRPALFRCFQVFAARFGRRPCLAGLAATDSPKP